ncbi:MAG: 16S rRNA (uracil(1498)-N(3))-methyltransferase [Prevotella sp.]|nr:16S rRNA (uracil(1498)-N(3))-methyltransferase [Prevotella sp.]MCF0207808.1 16S rRNA (uracil(1498)-N(3))-methyltransferase [Bacteroidaceae bacterium]
MKEERFFYVPDAQNNIELPEDEAKHAVSVLRLQVGDEIFLIDGEGSFHRAEITMATKKHCNYNILESVPQEREWQGRIHLAMAPTKMMERTEWFAEKATEIGFDELSFLDCRLSERRQLRIDRIETKVVGAVKQSRKAWMPKVNDIIDFKAFIIQNNPKTKDGFYAIAHCYDDIAKVHLYEELTTIKPSAVTILIGPEGDFHHDEVLFAIENGYRSISLGTSRLRTETAALSAVMMARLFY